MKFRSEIFFPVASWIWVNTDPRLVMILKMYQNHNKTLIVSRKTSLSAQQRTIVRNVFVDIFWKTLMNRSLTENFNSSPPGGTDKQNSSAQQASLNAHNFSQFLQKSNFNFPFEWGKNFFCEYDDMQTILWLIFKDQFLLNQPIKWCSKGVKRNVKS